MAMQQAALFAPLTPPGVIVRDRRESEQRKQDGMAAALWTAEPWRVRAEAWLQARTAAFTSEDMVAAVGLPTGGVGVNRNGAVGALVSGWSRRKLIRRVGYASSTRPESHGALLSVWEPVGREQVA